MTAIEIQNIATIETSSVKSNGLWQAIAHRLTGAQDSPAPDPSTRFQDQKEKVMSTIARIDPAVLTRF
jgi:hypothetical protein